MLRLVGIPRTGLRAFATFSPLRNETTTLGSLMNQTTTVESDANDQYQMNGARKSVKKALPKRLVPLKYILHANFRKNNTIITLSGVSVDLNYEANNPDLTFNEKVLYYLRLPQRAIVSKSTGMIGFNKSQRGEYESSYQLAAFIFNEIQSRNLLRDPATKAPFEIRVKNYGSGRKGFFDCLLGKEGSSLVPHITKLSDYTKIKYGGVKSPKVRRV